MNNMTLAFKKYSVSALVNLIPDLDKYNLDSNFLYDVYLDNKGNIVIFISGDIF